MAPKQSSFVEGSMNDRVSAAPPADFLDEGTPTADYERHFAMDWRPPELKFGPSSDGKQHGYNNLPGNRNSFVSVDSARTSFTMRTATATTTTTKTPRGLFGKVREKLALHRSQSTWTVGRADEADEEDDDTGSHAFLANFPVPPVFKHKRSESMDPSTLRADNQAATESGMFRRDAAATMSRPAPPARADSLGTALSSFDPTKRPTREEITANYQSLLASGFFGTHAIQSTRFSPPGAKLHRSNDAPSDVPSLAQKLEEEEEEEVETSQAGTNIPSSPVRQPPPPPPPMREPPPPPPPGMAMDVEDDEPESATPAAIPASSTAVFNPLPPPRTTSSCGADTSMSPPPLPGHAFSSVPYTSTRPGAEPTLTARPYRPPPVALARFSVDSSRPRSLDAGPFSRGIKRPFSSATTNDSQASFYTHRSSYDYDPMATDGHGGIGVATTTAEEKVESGARKLVKRLKKSASKLSFRSSHSTKFGGEGNEDGEDGAELQQPPSRTSMSSTVRRSFSWRLGSSRPGTSSDAHPSTSSFSSSSAKHHIFGGFRNPGEGDTFSLNNPTNSSMDHFQPPPPSVPAMHPPSPPRGLPAIAASPSSADRNRAKKREIRTRRLRRKEESASSTSSPLKQQQQQQQQQSMDAMDWQRPPPSPSKRPRRSDASIFLRALDSAGAGAAVVEDEGESSSDFEPDMPVPLVDAEAAQSPPPSAAPSEGMEGVEFSFHFPGRMRPGGGTGAANGNGNRLGGPLAVMPDVNKGVPSVTSAFGGFGAKKTGSVRVVRGDLV